MKKDFLLSKSIKKYFLFSAICICVLLFSGCMSNKDDDELNNLIKTEILDKQNLKLVDTVKTYLGKIKNRKAKNEQA